jgi:hypothetical protein
VRSVIYAKIFSDLTEIIINMKLKKNTCMKYVNWIQLGHGMSQWRTLLELDTTLQILYDRIP